MLLELSKSCTLGCSHCMNSSLPTKEFISTENIKIFSNIIKDLYIPFITISGSGEITDHPEFYKIIKYLITENPGKMFIISTNGMFFNDPQKLEHILELTQIFNILSVQINTDKRFYPEYQYALIKQKSIEFEKVSKFFFCIDGIGAIIPHGRAKKLNYITLSKHLACANIYLIAKQLVELDLTDNTKMHKYILQNKLDSFNKKIINFLNSNFLFLEQSRKMDNDTYNSLLNDIANNFANQSAFFKDMIKDYTILIINFIRNYNIKNKQFDSDFIEYISEQRQLIINSSMEKWILNINPSISERKLTKFEQLLNIFQFSFYNNALAGLCKPSIDIDLNIRAGESLGCNPLGNLKEHSLNDIMDKIINESNLKENYPCNNCKNVINLPDDAYNKIFNL